MCFSIVSVIQECYCDDDHYNHNHDDDGDEEEEKEEAMPTPGFEPLTVPSNFQFLDGILIAALHKCTSESHSSIAIVWQNKSHPDFAMQSI